MSILSGEKSDKAVNTVCSISPCSFGMQKKDRIHAPQSCYCAACIFIRRRSNAIPSGSADGSSL